MATGPDPASRIAASAAWWAAFWARSYISIPQPPPVPQALMATCSGDASQTVLQAPNGSLTLPGGLCFVASASNAIEARPCSQAPPAARGPSCSALRRGARHRATSTWPFRTQRILPLFLLCEAKGALVAHVCPCRCPALALRCTQTVFDIPGAVCANPLDTYAAVTPQGEFKNEIFYYNATDSTLRVSLAVYSHVTRYLQRAFQSPPDAMFPLPRHMCHDGGADSSHHLTGCHLCPVCAHSLHGGCAGKRGTTGRCCCSLC